jgi:T5orf172 domain
VTHTDTESTMKSGYLYVLVHPSDPDLYKVGQTTRHPQERLVEHNSNYSELAGQIVKETGQKWELKTYIAVPDPNWAERVFWEATGLAFIPFRGGIEVERMEWKLKRFPSHLNLRDSQTVSDDRDFVH